MQFGARRKTWLFSQMEDFENSDLLYRNFRTHLTQFLEGNGYESPKDEDQVCVNYFLIFLI